MEESIEPEAELPPEEESIEPVSELPPPPVEESETGSGVAAPVARGRIDRTGSGVAATVTRGRIDRTGSGVGRPRRPRKNR